MNNLNQLFNELIDTSKKRKNMEFLLEFSDSIKTYSEELGKCVKFSYDYNQYNYVHK